MIDRLTPYDFLHPLTPSLLQPVVGLAGQFLEFVPVIREFAGSVLLVAHKQLS
jgi:hypothetical protein